MYNYVKKFIVQTSTVNVEDCDFLFEIYPIQYTALKCIKEIMNIEVTRKNKHVLSYIHKIYQLYINDRNIEMLRKINMLTDTRDKKFNSYKLVDIDKITGYEFIRELYELDVFGYEESTISKHPVPLGTTISPNLLNFTIYVKEMCLVCLEPNDSLSFCCSKCRNNHDRLCLYDTFRFGKYKNSTINSILLSDPSYCIWLVTDKNPTYEKAKKGFKKNIKYCLAKYTFEQYKRQKNDILLEKLSK